MYRTGTQYTREYVQRAISAFLESREPHAKQLESHTTALPAACRLIGMAEPVWQADGRAVGCRVAGFKSLPDGTAGQAQRLGEARAGDVLTEINGVPVRDTSFDKVKREMGVGGCRVPGRDAALFTATMRTKTALRVDLYIVGTCIE